MHGQVLAQAVWRTRENTSGKVPPTLMPVMMRSISSCQ